MEDEKTDTALTERLDLILQSLRKIESLIVISDQEQRAKLDMILEHLGLRKRGGYSKTLLEERELRLREERLRRKEG
ncbi:MAG: hypothetical protein J2P21_20625 [Chloracidobacterium sp.]|nr:hypothetical protein [Chloracidobacterium sp.]